MLGRGNGRLCFPRMMLHFRVDIDAGGWKLLSYDKLGITHPDRCCESVDVSLLLNTPPSPHSLGEHGRADRWCGFFFSCRSMFHFTQIQSAIGGIDTPSSPIISMPSYGF